MPFCVELDNLKDTDAPIHQPAVSASEAAGVSLRTAYKALANPRIRYFGGWDEGQLVSSCTLTVIPNLTRACRPYGVIENVVTHTVHCGDGWGRALLQRTLAHAWRERCYKVMLMTGRKDENTLRFSNAHGCLLRSCLL